MKNICVWTILLLVGLLSLPLDVFAVSDEWAALKEAEEELDAAEQELEDTVNGSLGFIAGTVISAVDPDGETSPISSAITGHVTDRLEEHVDDKKNEVEKAKMAVSSAEYALEQSRTPDLAACGHPMPGHNRYQYGCGHFDYSCDEAEHQLRSSGYRMCGGS